MAVAPELEDLRGLAARAARDGLRRMNATLHRDRFEDLVSDVVIVGLRAMEKYAASYGQAASTHAYRTMRPRVVDWMRRTLGDRRHHDPLLHPRSALLYGGDGTTRSVPFARNVGP